MFETDQYSYSVENRGIKSKDRSWVNMKEVVNSIRRCVARAGVVAEKEMRNWMLGVFCKCSQRDILRDSMWPLREGEEEGIIPPCLTSAT